MIPQSSSILNIVELFGIDENDDPYHDNSSDDFNISPFEPFEFTDDQRDLAQSSYPCDVPYNTSNENPPQTNLNTISHEDHSSHDQQQNPTDQVIIQENSNDLSNTNETNEQSEIDFSEFDNIIDNDENDVIKFDKTEEIPQDESNIIRQMPSKKDQPLGKNLKNRVDFSQKQENFRSSYYLLLLRKKKVFDKSYVKKIHDYMRGFLHFPPMTRKQFRTISYYFKDYAAYDSQIISFLNDHKNDILQLMPGLCQMK